MHSKHGISSRDQYLEAWLDETVKLNKMMKDVGQKAIGPYLSLPFSAFKSWVSLEGLLGQLIVRPCSS